MKAQVSLEYLSTYSWAIIILLAIISALNYFGFFNLGIIGETSCDTGTFLQCNDVKFVRSDSNTGTVYLMLQNKMKDDIELTRDIKFIDLDFPVQNCGWGGQNISRGNIWISNGCNISNEYFVGDLERMSFELYYMRAGGGPEHVISGSFKTYVQE